MFNEVTDLLHDLFLDGLVLLYGQMRLPMLFNIVVRINIREKIDRICQLIDTAV